MSKKKPYNIPHIEALPWAKMKKMQMSDIAALVEEFVNKPSNKGKYRIR